MNCHYGKKGVGEMKINYAIPEIEVFDISQFDELLVASACTCWCVAKFCLANVLDG